MPFISRLSTTPNGKYQNRIATVRLTADAAISLEDTCRTQTSISVSAPFEAWNGRTGCVRLGHTRLFTFQSTNRNGSTMVLRRE
jgi:hypothetical protein